MDKPQQTQALLGLDIGFVNTRAAYIGIKEEKYRLQGVEIAPTSLGPGLHLGTGAGSAMRQLQNEHRLNILNPAGRLMMPIDTTGKGVDRLAMVLSAGPWLKTVLMGLTSSGSMAAGKALIASLPLDLSAAFGLADLMDEQCIIDDLVRLRPEVLIITGGEDAGAEKTVNRWLSIAHVFCSLLRESERPVIIYAGNPLLESTVKRMLEPLTTLKLLPNLQPEHGELDLVPSQVVLDQEILRIWRRRVPGFSDLHQMSKALIGTKSFMLSRMVRYLGQTRNSDPKRIHKNGVLALDLGGGCTTLSVGFEGKTGTLTQRTTMSSDLPAVDEPMLQRIQQWSSVPVTLQEVSQWLFNTSIHNSVVPETSVELALAQAYARVKIQDTAAKLSGHHSWFPYSHDQGLSGHFEPIIASGAVLTQAPTPGQTMLMLLDGLQPRGITTMVLDKNHILPIMGVVGGEDPIIPIQILESNAFQNLGSVVVPISDAPEGETILRIMVRTNTGKDYEVEIHQGTLRRIVIPADVSAVLELEPARHTDIGFGGSGVGGRLKVYGGVSGVIIDARGRPLHLPQDQEVRIAKLGQWLDTLGG